jgi:hypothetical protein
VRDLKKSKKMTTDEDDRRESGAPEPGRNT